MAWGLDGPRPRSTSWRHAIPSSTAESCALELPALMGFWESEDTDANGLLSMSEAVWQRSYQMLRDYGYLDEEFDPTEVYTNEYLPE